MDKDKNNIALELQANVDAVDKCIDTLADYKVFIYSYLCVSEKIFENIIKIPFEHRSAYLQGAQDVLTELQSLPNRLLEIKKQIR